MPAMEVIDFDPRHAGAFRTLNEAWIRRYFEIEPKDMELLADPQRQIIDKGGRVLFALVDGVPAGCCSLVPMADGGLELAKMAVDDAFQGRGLAKALMMACVERARDAGAWRLYLESSVKLTPALTLYRAFGFRDLPPERRPPSPYARASVWMELVINPKP